MVQIKNIEILTKHEFFEFLDSQFNAFPLRDENIDSWLTTGYGPADDNSSEATEVNRWGIEVLVDPDGAYRVRTLYRITSMEAPEEGYLFTEGETFPSAMATFLAVGLLAVSLENGEGPTPTQEVIDAAIARHNDPERLDP